MERAASHRICTLVNTRVSTLRVEPADGDFGEDDLHGAFYFFGGAQQDDGVIFVELVIRAGADLGRAVADDGDDGGAAFAAEVELAEVLAHDGRGSIELDRFRVCRVKRDVDTLHGNRRHCGRSE